MFDNKTKVVLDYTLNKETIIEIKGEKQHDKLNCIVNDCNKVIADEYITLNEIKNVIEEYKKDVTRAGLKNVMKMQERCTEQKRKFDKRIFDFNKLLEYIDNEEFDDETKMKADSTRMCVVSTIGTFEEMSKLTRQFILTLDSVISTHSLNFGMKQIKKMSGLNDKPEKKKVPWSNNTKVILHSSLTFVLFSVPFSLIWLPEISSLLTTIMIIIPILCMIINTFYVMKKYDYLKDNNDIEENVASFIGVIFVSYFFSLYHFIKALLGHYEKRVITSSGKRVSFYK